MQDDRAATIAGLRAAADFFEQTPDAPLPYSIDLGVHCFGREEFVTAVRALGNARKDFSSAYAEAGRDFGGGVQIRYQAARDQVCERVVVGTETREVEEPDPDAVAALPKVKRTEVVEQVEWRCEPLLAPPASELADAA